MSKVAVSDTLVPLDLVQESKLNKKNVQLVKFKLCCFYLF